jgi:hypothetical protein
LDAHVFRLTCTDEATSPKGFMPIR